MHNPEPKEIIYHVPETTRMVWISADDEVCTHGNDLFEFVSGMAREISRLRKEACELRTGESKRLDEWKREWAGVLVNAGAENSVLKMEVENLKRKLTNSQRENDDGR